MFIAVYYIFTYVHCSIYYYNNNEYLERLTLTGPKHLHVLYKYILSEFNAYNMNARTHACTHTQTRTRTHTHHMYSSHQPKMPRCIMNSPVYTQVCAAAEASDVTLVPGAAGQHGGAGGGACQAGVAAQPAARSTERRSRRPPD